MNLKLFDLGLHKWLSVVNMCLFVLDICLCLYLLVSGLFQDYNIVEVGLYNFLSLINEDIGKSGSTVNIYAQKSTDY